MTRRLKRARESLGLSRLEMSRRTKLAPSTYGRIERGDESPYPVWRQRITDVIREAGGETEGLFETEKPHEAASDPDGLEEANDAHH